MLSHEWPTVITQKARKDQIQNLLRFKKHFYPDVRLIMYQMMLDIDSIGQTWITWSLRGIGRTEAKVLVLSSSSLLLQCGY